VTRANADARPPRPPLDILFLTRNSALAEQLRPFLRAHGLALETFESPDRLMRHPSAGSGALLLIDSEALPNPDMLGALAEDVLGRVGSPMPLACLVSERNIRLRLAAMRAGAKACLQAQMEIEELAERVIDLVDAGAARPDRVLVVDDQPVAALFAARVLESAGMLVEQVGDPLTVLEALDAFGPDLVLMDLHMPGASGIELTRIIREQDRFADVPVVFLSTELDAEQQMAALRVGGDDFLAKPVSPDHLIDCVEQRLRRARERERRRGAGTAIDPLTGLASLGRLLERLGQLIGRGGAGVDRRALVSVELAGDEDALSRLAAVVAEQTRAPDLAARVGEGALAILIRRDDATDLAGACESLADDLDRLCPELGLGVGWCGLASSGGDAVTLLSRAAKAARSALASGDRRPVGYSREPAAQDRDTPGPLLTAILSERLQLLFEPMVTLMQAPVARYEVSPRLAICDGELLPPSEFMSFAQQSGLLERIDCWLLTSGLDALRARQAAGQPVQLFLHQSFDSIGREDWVEQVRDEINRRDLFRLRPVLQFQVQEVASDPELVAERVARLARIGIRVCLNGLDASEGSGRAVAMVPAAFVRLARAVVQSPDHEPLGDLIRGLKARGLVVIAAGVDAPETIARLCRAGADLLQGPFVQPPSAVMDYDFGGADAA
jgi:DNA-binding response OmpR family regulator/EAL domain-containing protein (putative c-di-GMP-specific phosphodiesterase class I)